MLTRLDVEEEQKGKDEEEMKEELEEAENDQKEKDEKGEQADEKYLKRKTIKRSIDYFSLYLIQRVDWLLS